jgi:UTP-glucose-1-phosphate uridylyltransferase
MQRPIKKAIFPVAGLGTRFLPATKAMPKEMLTIVDRPLIQIAVDEAREAGIEHFIFVTGRNKSVIEDHFDKQYELTFSKRICLQRDKPVLLASRSRWDWAMPFGARATSWAMSLLPFYCLIW